MKIFSPPVFWARFLCSALKEENGFSVPMTWNIILWIWSKCNFLIQKIMRNLRVYSNRICIWRMKLTSRRVLWTRSQIIFWNCLEILRFSVICSSVSVPRSVQVVLYYMCLPDLYVSLLQSSLCYMSKTSVKRAVSSWPWSDTHRWPVLVSVCILQSSMAFCTFATQLHQHQSPTLYILEKDLTVSHPLVAACVNYLVMSDLTCPSRSRSPVQTCGCRICQI